ncbi:hypothetical protein BJA01nite_73150 [Bradyrhizobium japonicum]|nr:hypothetical protein BJA01nite_73150 [Bradyrhizobium japonicum]
MNGALTLYETNKHAGWLHSCDQLEAQPSDPYIESQRVTRKLAVRDSIAERQCGDEWAWI